MSFLSGLGSFFKTAFHDVEAGLAVSAPIIQLALPFVPNGSVAATILQGAVLVEQLITAPHSGAQKKETLTALVNSIHPGLDPAVVSSGIDMGVALLNKFAVAAPAA